MEKPEIVKNGVLCCQACIPETWSTDAAQDWVNSTNPTGIISKWNARRDGHEYLLGCPSRVPCEEREGFVHIMFDC